MIKIRPPITNAMKLWFGEDTVTVSQASLWTDSFGVNMVTFQLHSMMSDDAEACAPAETVGIVENDDGEKFYRSGADMPSRLLHSTTLDNGLSILRDGYIKIGSGICGKGIYGFALPDDSREALEQTLHRGSRGGYNRACGVGLKIRGMLINGANVGNAYEVPQGCTSFKKDQFAASQSVVQYETITFHLDGLAARLDRHLEEVGCSTVLLQKLVAIQKRMDAIASTSSSSRSRSPLANTFTGPSILVRVDA